MITIISSAHAKFNRSQDKSILVYVQIEDKTVIHKRLIPFEVKSAYNAELMGIKYALECLQEKTDVTILCSTPHIATAFQRENNQWTKGTENETTQEIRTLLEQFKSFGCGSLEPERLKKCRETMKLAVSI